MSNPYTQPTLSGYNVTPPADDGSKVSTNAVKWSNHIDKIGNPLKTFAQAVDSNILTAFGLTFGASFLTKSTAYTVAAADRGRIIEVTGTTTITLLAAATAGDGFPILIVNTGAALVTIDGDGAETINGDTTKILPPGAGALLTCDASTWVGHISAEVGSFTGTLTGYASPPAGTVRYTIGNGHAIIHLPSGLSGTSNTTAMTMTGLPAVLSPIFDVRTPTTVQDGGGQEIGVARISPAGTVITFATGSPMSISGFTASGSKGWQLGASIAYALG